MLTQNHITRLQNHITPAEAFSFSPWAFLLSIFLVKFYKPFLVDYSPHPCIYPALTIKTIYRASRSRKRGLVMLTRSQRRNSHRPGVVLVVLSEIMTRYKAFLEHFVSHPYITKGLYIKSILRASRGLKRLYINTTTHADRWKPSKKRPSPATLGNFEKYQKSVIFYENLPPSHFHIMFWGCVCRFGIMGDLVNSRQG